MPAEPLLRVRDLSKTYFHRRWLAAPRPAMVALAGVSFTLERGRTLAVVGASGSGKSTLARCLTQFETPTGGEILFEGSPLSPHRRLDIQLIFQQPAASLNPRFTAAEIVEEPLVIQRAGTGAERRRARRVRPGVDRDRAHGARQTGARIQRRRAAAPGHRPRPGGGAQGTHPGRELQRTRRDPGGPDRRAPHRTYSNGWGSPISSFRMTSRWSRVWPTRSP